MKRTYERAFFMLIGAGIAFIAYFLGEMDKYLRIIISIYAFSETLATRSEKSERPNLLIM